MTRSYDCVDSPQLSAHSRIFSLENMKNKNVYHISAYTVFLGIVAVTSICNKVMELRPLDKGSLYSMAASMFKGELSPKSTISQMKAVTS